MLAWRADLRRITDGHPPDRDHGAWRQNGVDLDDAADPHLAACPGDASGEQGHAGGQEAAVADLRAVDMGMRPDQHIVADDDGVPSPAADHRVLHHDAAGADADLPVFGAQHGPEQHASIRPDAHRAADDRRGRDISTWMDLRDTAAMLDQHAPSLPGSRCRSGGDRGIVRRRDDRDNRLIRFWLTDAGRALREPIEAERRLLEDKLTADLTKPEREHLLSALAKIYRSALDLRPSRACSAP
jgi:hypothetical protein